MTDPIRTPRKATAYPAKDHYNVYCHECSIIFDVSGKDEIEKCPSCGALSKIEIQLRW